MNIVVLGMHRSGTSVTANLLNALGAYVGPEQALLPAGPENPKGYWELRRTMELNDMILATASATWRYPVDFSPDKLTIEQRANIQESIKKLVLDMSVTPCTLLKDPRFSLTLPLWKPFLDPCIYIHVTRDPLEVARSLADRDSISIPYGLALWEWYNTHAIAVTEGLDGIRVDYSDLLSKPGESVKRMLSLLQQHSEIELKAPDEQQLNEIADSRLKHQSANVEDLRRYLSIKQQQLRDFLCSSALDDTAEFQQISPVADFVLRTELRSQRTQAAIESIYNLVRSKTIADTEQRAPMDTEQAPETPVGRNNIFGTPVPAPEVITARATIELLDSRLNHLTAHYNLLVSQAAEERALHAATRSRLSYAQQQLHNEKECHERTVQQLIIARKCNEWMRALTRDIESLMASFTWRIGTFANRCFQRLMLRRPNNTIEPQIRYTLDKLAKHLEKSEHPNNES